jgi:uncharacterized membrane protein (DUF485 family)
MRSVLSDARRGHPALYVFAAAMLALSVTTAVLLVVDQRTLLGAPLWAKPLKFAVSLGLYAATLAWMLGRLEPGPTGRRPLRLTGWLLVVAAAVEIAIITGQAARGERSHFNVEEADNALLFSLMGVTIVALYLATAAVALRFLRGPAAPERTAVRLGLLVSLLGMTVGWVMIAVGGHTVGAADGGPGLPLVGWSTAAGDLRVAHFVGLHALQLLPLLVAALRGTTRLDDGALARIVVGAGAGYAALVVLLTAQALRAQPLLAPDVLTLAGLVAVAVGTGAAVAPALRRSRGPVGTGTRR